MIEKRKVTDSFRLEVIEDYLSSGQSKSSIARKYNLGGADTIRQWMKRMKIQDPYKREVVSTTLIGMNHKSYSKVKKEKEVQSLEKRITELEKELYKAKMGEDFYRTMVDIAEKEFKIEIRKKSGTKQ